MTLWVSGKGWASSGLTTLYLPTVMELLLMSSEMHLVWPDGRSNRTDSDVDNKNPRIRRKHRLLNRTMVKRSSCCLFSERKERRAPSLGLWRIRKQKKKEFRTLEDKIWVREKMVFLFFLFVPRGDQWFERTRNSAYTPYRQPVDCNVLVVWGPILP